MLGHETYIPLDFMAHELVMEVGIETDHTT